VSHLFSLSEVKAEAKLHNSVSLRHHPALHGIEAYHPASNLDFTSATLLAAAETARQLSGSPVLTEVEWEKWEK
jgi:hypothetical protein